MRHYKASTSSDQKEIFLPAKAGLRIVGVVLVVVVVVLVVLVMGQTSKTDLKKQFRGLYDKTKNLTIEKIIWVPFINYLDISPPEGVKPHLSSSQIGKVTKSRISSRYFHLQIF